MAKAEFSELQFAFGFLHHRVEMLRRKGFFIRCCLPTLRQEAKEGYDAILRTYSHSEFYQFKIGGYQEKDALSYWFEIYNKRTEQKGDDGQLDLLIKLAQNNSRDLVCYCAPCFYTDNDFHKYFNSSGVDTIIEHSVLIGCGQFSKWVTEETDGSLHKCKLRYNCGKDEGEQEGCLQCPGKQSVEEQNKPKIKTHNAKKLLHGFPPATLSMSFPCMLGRLRRIVAVEKIESEEGTIKEGVILHVQKLLLQKYRIAWLPVFRQNSAK